MARYALAPRQAAVPPPAGLPSFHRECRRAEAGASKMSAQMRGGDARYAGVLRNTQDIAQNAHI